MTSVPNSNANNLAFVEGIVQPENPEQVQTNIADVLQAAQLLALLNSNIAPPQNTINENNLNKKESSSGFSSSFFKYDDFFRKQMGFKHNATNIVYVEGLPSNTTEREIAHLFRPFPGFKSVRLISREKNGGKSLICFADFESILQSTICINTLQGYRFDKRDLVGLHFSYGVSKR